MSRRAFVVAASAASAVASTSTHALAAAKAEKVYDPALVGKSNFGQCADDEALRAGWKKFCKTLEEAGDLVFKAYNPATPSQRADGYRFLTQNLGQAFDFSLEKNNTQYPEVHLFVSPFCKLGGDNPDCIYQSAWIDGKTAYKVTGNKGTARIVNFTLMGPRLPPKDGWRPLSEPFGDIPHANIYAHDLETDAQGNFELFIGGPKREKNWLETKDVTRKLFIRQLFDDFKEAPAILKIERVGMLEPRPAPTPADVIKAMEWSGNFLTTTMQDNPEWGFQFSSMTTADVNTFPTDNNTIRDSSNNAKVDKFRGRTINNMNWKLAPDEAMLLEFDDPKSFWQLGNMGVFFNSMDFYQRTISWTPSRTKVDKDGKIRFVMSHDDPGYHNWIDTTGFTVGNLTSRNFLSDKFVDIHTRVVKRSKVAAAMPKDSVKVTKDERSAQMLERFHAIQKRYVL
jgi:hypothetical protein